MSKHEIHARLKAAKEAIELSDSVSGNEQETREIRSAVSLLIGVVEDLHEH